MKQNGKVTIVDIAKVAEFPIPPSRGWRPTIPRQPETRERVLAAMEQLGYVANSTPAACLLENRSGWCARPCPRTEYAGEIIRGIEEELAAVDYDLMLYTIIAGGKKRSTFRRSRAVLQKVSACYPDGAKAI